MLGSTVGGISARVQYEVGACRYWRAECLDGGQCWPVVGGEVGMVYCGVHRGLGKRRVTCATVFGAFKCLWYRAMVGIAVCRLGALKDVCESG